MSRKSGTCIGPVPFLRSVLIWIAIVVVTVAIFVVMLPCALLALPFDRKRNIAHFFARLWGRALFKINPAIRVHVEGEERLREIGGDGAAVLCSNHESMADIIALYYLGHPFKWISKVEVFYVPLIGQAMWLAGYIPLKRGDKDSIKRCMAAADAWLRRGVSITMFPEGTRSFDGRVKAFKDGAFRMSVDSGAPIVPLAIKGPRDLVKKGSWIFAPRVEIGIRVGSPIRPKPGAERESEIARLREETRSWIVRNVAEQRHVAPETVDATAARAAPALAE